MYNFNVWLAWILGVDQYIIQVYNNKDIQLFSQNLINIFLKGSQNIRKAKKHDLVFEISILDPESCFLFIIFTNFYLIIGISKIQLGKSPYLAKLIQQLVNQKQQILIFYGNIIKILIIHTKAKVSI